MATTLGVIIGNRGFFPAILARDGREEILRTLEQQGYKSICLTPQETKYGSVETLQDARKCADLFKQHGNEIDGILVSLPNFGDERGVANTIRMSGLEVPVLIHAFPDDPGKMLSEHAPRQLLRKDVGLQQPLAVRNPLYAHLAAYGDPFLSRLCGRLEGICRYLPDCEGAQERPGGCDRRATRGLQHGAFQREADGEPWHQRRNAGPLRSPGPHSAAEG